MFVAKFQQVTSDKFKSDKNGQKPFIGEIMAGSSDGSIINGTMFQRDGLKPNTLYACENFIDAEHPDSVQTRIVSEVSIVEYMSLKPVLGEPVNNHKSTTVTEVAGTVVTEGAE